MQEQRRQQEHRRDRGEVGRGDERAVAEGGHAEQSQGDERGAARLRVAMLPAEEEDSEDGEQRERPPPPRIVVRRSGGEEERPHQGDDDDGEEAESDRIQLQTRGARHPRLGQQPDHPGEHGEAQGNVDPEDESPAVLRAAERDHEAAERRAERRGDPDRRPEQPEGTAALLAREQLLDGADDLRHLDAGGETLHEAAGEQDLGRRSHRAHDRGEGEQAQTDDEELLARALVTEASERHEGEAEQQDVARDDDLEFGGFRAECLLDRRQGDVDLAEVEDGERRDRDAHPERAPALSVVERDAGGRGRGHRPQRIPARGSVGCRRLAREVRAPGRVGSRPDSSGSPAGIRGRSCPRR